MSATFQQARQFAIATAVCLGVALAAGLAAGMCGTSTRSGPRVELPPAYYPMAFALWFTVLLAGVTACLLIAGVIEGFLRRGRQIAEPGASPNGGPTMGPGNSGAGGGPPLVS